MEICYEKTGDGVCVCYKNNKKIQPIGHFDVKSPKDVQFIKIGQAASVYHLRKKAKEELNLGDRVNLHKNDSLLFEFAQGKYHLRFPDVHSVRRV